MIEAVAAVPHPPLLCDELAGAAAGETAELRTACREAARRLAEVSPRWVAVGADPRPGTWDASARGTFAAFGADVEVALGPGAATLADPRLPLPLLVAGWLRGGLPGAAAVRVEGVVLDPATGPDEARRCGEEIARGAGEGPLGLLVLGDGPATLTAKAPGAFDPRADAHDTAVASALGAADTSALAALDPALCAALGTGGRVAWQVLAGAVDATVAASWRPTVLHASRPFGVGYHVAVWDRA